MTFAERIAAFTREFHRGIEHMKHQFSTKEPALRAGFENIRIQLDAARHAVGRGV